MIKYTTLDAVLNYVPQPIIREFDTIQLKSWMMQFYRMKNLKLQEEVKTAVINISEGRAGLPTNVRRILDLRYQDTPVPETLTVNSKEIDVDKLLIYQQLFFSDPYYIEAKPLRYIGQMKSALINEELYCSDCANGFTVDSTMTCLTTTMVDGAVLLVYTVDVTDDSDEVLIPDDSTLLMALSWAVQAEYWNLKKFSHEANAQNYHTDALMKAQKLYTRFSGKRLLAGINPHAHNEFVFRRNLKPIR